MRMLWVLALSSSVQADAVLDRGNGPEPTTLDVHRGSEVGSQNILTDLYEGLVAFAADGGIVPGMAERWEVAADGRTWTFHLRTGLRWSNGESLDAPQFVASMQRALDPDTAAPLASLFASIRNAPAVMRGAMAPTALGIRAPDVRTVVIELTQPTALLERLALPVAAPLHLPSLRRHGMLHTRPGNLIGNGALPADRMDAAGEPAARTQSAFPRGRGGGDRARALSRHRGCEHRAEALRRRRSRFHRGGAAGPARTPARALRHAAAHQPLPRQFLPRLQPASARRLRDSRNCGARCRWRSTAGF